MKRLKQLTVVILMTFLMAMTSFAGQWMQDYSGWWYQNDDGSYPVNGWQWIDGNGDGIAEYYYFDDNGYCLMNTITPDGNLVDANGALVIAGMVQTQAVNVPVVTGTEYPVEASMPMGTEYPVEASVPIGTEYPVEVSVPMGTEYPVEATVWLSATGSKYHRIPNCGRMNPSKARQVSLNEAVAQGYERCKNCY